LISALTFLTLYRLKIKPESNNCWNE